MNDRYGQAVTTSSATALQRYAEGLDLDQSQNYGAEEKFRQAIEADEGFALLGSSRSGAGPSPAACASCSRR